AASRDGLDELRRSGIVAERCPQLRDSLCQRIVGNIRTGPEGVEQLLLGHQRAGVIEEMQQQVEQLRREIQHLVATEHAVTRTIDGERTESVLRLGHAGRLYAG